MANLTLKFVASLATISLLAGCSAPPATNSSISVKAQTVSNSLAGRWQVDLSAGPTLIATITPEGTLYITESSSNETVEMGQIKKISDVGTLPPGTKISGSFENQANQAKQSEAKTYVGAINRAQQAFYLESGRFSADVPSLGIGIETEGTNYQYSTNQLGEGAVQNIGLAKVEGLKSYTGIVAVRRVGNENLTVAVLCESNKPTTALPPKPSQSEINNSSCPAGYSVVDR
ncbi:type IV pilin-like G/H family protein [Trichocoleus desertorum AS-A10]|uniref:type IV pilin-like G/H family protein n=1 Tax=Trichocoleus desertorum TaxID=1481672 RepID=UPI0032999E7E